MNHPGLTALNTLLERMRDLPNEPLVEKLPLLSSLVSQPGLPREIIHSELQRAKQTEGYIPPTISGVSLELPASSRARAILTFHRATARPQAAYLTSDPSETLVGVFSGTFEIIDYKQEATDSTVLSRTPVILQSAQSLSNGATAHFKPTLGPRLIHATTSGWTIRIVNPPTIPFVWQYEMASGLPVRAISAATEDSRLEFAAKVLGNVGNSESAPVLESLVAHDAHNVRWQAAASLTRLDQAAGLAMCEGLLHDPHPHVRKAAQKTINNFSGVPVGKN